MGFWGLDEDPLGVVGVVDRGVTARFAELGDDLFDQRDGFGLSHAVLFAEEFQPFGVVSEVHSDFSADQQLAEDARGVGVRESEAQGVFLDLIGEGENLVLVGLGCLKVDTSLS